MATRDLGKLEDDMGSIQNKAMPKPAPKPAPNPLDANIYTADKGQPPSPDEGPTKSSKPVKKAKGGSVGSASRRADGIAQRGKTKGRIV